MKYYIKQRVFTFREKFDIKDQHDRVAYKVVGRIMTLSKKFDIMDTKGKSKAKVRRQIISIFPRYSIKIDGEKYVLKRKFSFFKHKFVVTNTNWKLKGDFINRSYDILENGHAVMTLRKHWFSWGDSYEIRIPKKEDELLALAIAIALDAELARNKQEIRNIKAEQNIN